MPGSVVAGLLAAAVATLPLWALGKMSGASAPVLILGVAALAMVLQRFVLDRQPGNRSYDGLADLMIHIHSPSSPDSPARWAIRGLVSLLFAACGAPVGPEGAAVEVGHAYAIRSRAKLTRWFEQRRRSDASRALAAGVSAAFGAPFAGFVLPLELGMGGRHAEVLVASISAFLGAGMLRSYLGLPPASLAGILGGTAHSFGPGLAHWGTWTGALAIGAAAGVAGLLLIRFLRYAQESLLDLFQMQAWMRTLAAGVLLFLVALVFRPSYSSPAALFEQTLRGMLGVQEAGLLLLSGTLSLAMLISGFGTVGIFWPLAMLGAALGFALDHVALRSLDVPASIAGLAGASGLWGAVLGAPIAGAVLAFELTGDAQALLPCLVAGFAARWLREKAFRTPPLVELDLEARGLALIEGRSAAVLESVPVADAMVTDHELVHEQEPVSEIHAKLRKSRYPFLPVVNSANAYVGLLTVDLVQEAWRAQSVTSNSPLAGLLEAKDLLYRSSVKVPCLKVDDRLSATGGLFGALPCVVVLADDRRVMGLLFAHHVRLAYDREVARRSLRME